MRTTALLLALTVLLPSAARADVIQITSGTLFLNSRGAGGAFSGDTGHFTVQIDWPLFPLCLCQPGGSITPGGSQTGMDVVGTFTVDDVTYYGANPLDFTGPHLNQFFRVIGPSIDVPFLPVGATAILTGPVTISSVFTYSAGDTFLTQEFAGQGIFSVQVTGGLFGDTPVLLTETTQARIDAIAPEPTSLLLLGSGLIGIWRRRAALTRVVSRGAVC